MSDEARESIHIDAPPERCYAVAVDFDRYPRWATDVREVEVLERDAEGRGTRVRYQISALGKTIGYILRYDFAAAPGGFAWKLDKADYLKRLDGAYRFDADGSGTEVGYVLTDRDPDYVVLGETLSYNLEMVTQAIRLVSAGARFIATNPDPTGPSEAGIIPACGAMAALIERATGVKPYFVGKPNPLMMRRALNFLGTHSEQTIMVGDRMDTDIVAGMEAGMETILVLSGVTRAEDVDRFPYRPTQVLPSIASIQVA